jgi:ABC-type polysaccharide/polyol phosphate transport system ATPase subunit
MVHIELHDLGVDFPLLQAEQRSFKRLLSVPFKSARFGVDHRERVVLHALRNINLTMGQGDRVALVGANGAGKSTLLRVLAGIYPPVFGSASISGRVGALLTAGLGLREDISGYENIEFSLLLQGFQANEISERGKEIAEFTELKDYLNLHVGAYSSGMRVRLAFAISTAIDADILLIDEMLGAGDAAFMKKAEARLTNLIHRSKILVLASHAADLSERFCDRAVWLDNGEIRADGLLREVWAAYLRTTMKR